ncbi:polyprenyl synthetase family protein [bacterium]|nr:polyprenyl synthetase family protein [bacterium]
MDTSKKIESIHGLIGDKLASTLSPYRELYHKEAHSVLPPGKLIRPTLLCLFGEAFGLTFEELVHPAIAVELIHVSSLIHDDLPDLDNSPTRRGKPSSHVAFGSASALLTGDALVARAIHLLVAGSYNDAAKTLLTREMTKAYELLCVGQLQDLELTKLGKNEPTREMREVCYRNKTGALFSFSLLAPTIIAFSKGMNCRQLFEIIDDLGISLGLLFQIKDDLDDVDGSDFEAAKEWEKVVENKIEKSFVEISTKLNLNLNFFQQYYQQIFKL